MRQAKVILAAGLATAIILATILIFAAIRQDDQKKTFIEKGVVMQISSPEFGNNEMIPSKFTCEGADINPPLSILGVPVEAKSLSLIIKDPDAPGKTWIHWVLYDMPVADQIKEDSAPGRLGGNDFGRKDYGGPCPPSGTHRYYFELYALDSKLGLAEGKSCSEVEKAMEGHILAKAKLVGLYKKQK